MTRASLPKREYWRPKLRTAAAMAQLCRAQLLINWVPFKHWRNGLGCQVKAGVDPREEEARQLAADVEWAAARIPFATKCLPRAMALSWLLRRRKVGHVVVIAVRPDQLRQSPDALHAWVEVESETILGELPGPWIVAARLGG